jgi:Flp pilus assembly pilin Flp
MAGADQIAGLKKRVADRVADRVQAFGREEEGSTAIEYSLIVSLIFLAIVASIRAFTGSTSEMYGEVTTTLEQATN